MCFFFVRWHSLFACIYDCDSTNADTQKDARHEKELFERKSLLPFQSEFFYSSAKKKKERAPVFLSLVLLVEFGRHLHVDGRCAAVSSTQMRITLGAKVWRKIRKEQKLCKHFRVLYHHDDDDNEMRRKAK